MADEPEDSSQTLQFVMVQDTVTAMQPHGTSPFSSSQPLFPATPTVEAFAQPHADHFVTAPLNFDHDSKSSLASDPIPDSALEAFENHHNSVEMGPTNTAFWTQDDYDFLANYRRKVDIPLREFSDSL